MKRIGAVFSSKNSHPFNTLHLVCRSLYMSLPIFVGIFLRSSSPHLSLLALGIRKTSNENRAWYNTRPMHTRYDEFENARMIASENVSNKF